MAHFLYATISCTPILSITFLKFSFGVDTLLPNQTIAVGQTLVSQSRVFELGFFTPGKSKNIFLGMWCESTLDIVVWVANQKYPITKLRGISFSISGNETLVMSRGGSVIWSANSMTVASEPVLQLLDTGNLVLIDKTMEGYMWQSFDHPTETWLPGMKIVDDVDAGVKYWTSWRNTDDPSPGDFVFRIENQGLPEMVIFKGTTKMFGSGRWNGLYLSGIPPFRNAVFKPELLFKQERLISIWWPYESSIVPRITLETSGMLHRCTMKARKDRLSPFCANPKDPCDAYGQCGPYGICRIEKALRCECFGGFSPKFKKDWELQDLPLHAPEIRH